MIFFLSHWLLIYIQYISGLPVVLSYMYVCSFVILIITADVYHFLLVMLC